MRVCLLIGPDLHSSARLQHALDAKRGRLADLGVLVPRSLGAKNHTRLFMAITDHIDPLRYGRGYGDADAQKGLFDKVSADLTAEIRAAKPSTVLLSAAQLGSSLYRPSELKRLQALLGPLGQVDIVAHVDEPALMAAQNYAHQVMDGRATGLQGELALVGRDWWDGALASMPLISPETGQFEETQGLPFWLDYKRLLELWESVFGVGTMRLRPAPRHDPEGHAILTEVAEITRVSRPLGRLGQDHSIELPSAAWLARARQLNALILQILGPKKYALPRKVWRDLLRDTAIDGPPIDAGSLCQISAHFHQANTALVARFPDLAPIMQAPCARAPWVEADPGQGYRATQYLLAFMHRIETATKEERTRRKPQAPAMSPSAQTLMSPQLQRTYDSLRASPFAPHNKMSPPNEDLPAPPFEPMPPRGVPKGSSGNVIVGCMKNEAPYILEWIAYHRAIGVDTFLIYTNGCEDGTDAILDRLQHMGLLQHRNNDNWKGNSPQQHALNSALKEKVIRQADWIIHIDVDEFINVRCDNGTLPDLFDRIGDASNVAMTWRLFGHNGVQSLDDRFVIDQFDHAAPKYCPKPHTVWGFKTMFKNIGAYSKISCHRPNKLDQKLRDQVKWVNGSGRDMTAEAADNGWRNSRASVGYDLVQLNHYALRSAESFLIKRQRGRALHVDRSIGLNYWIRMDWSDHRDITIKRNLPRLRAEYDRLLQDDTLRALHNKALQWHRKKADDLHKTPEFAELYQQAVGLKLTETERAAYALTLDMES